MDLMGLGLVLLYVLFWGSDRRGSDSSRKGLLLVTAKAQERNPSSVKDGVTPANIPFSERKSRGQAQSQVGEVVICTITYHSSSVLQQSSAKLIFRFVRCLLREFSLAFTSPLFPSQYRA